MGVRKCCIGALALAALPAAALAEDSKSRPQLEEVMVTAQKQQQSLQDVPIAVAAVDGAKIRDAGIQRIEELCAHVIAPAADVEDLRDVDVELGPVRQELHAFTRRQQGSVAPGAGADGRVGGTVNVRRTEHARRHAVVRGEERGRVGAEHATKLRRRAAAVDERLA